MAIYSVNKHIGYIYKYQNIVNGKVYIGQTVNLQSRMSSHRNKAKFLKNKFYNAVRKYGWASFSYEVIAEIYANSDQELTTILDQLEVYYVARYDSYYNGYNSTLGGHSKRGYKMSQEFIEKCKNRTYSKQTREKMSISASNRVISEQTRQKLREAAINRNFSQYRNLYRDKCNAAIKNTLAKSILQFDTKNNLMNKFDSIRDAAQYILDNISQKSSRAGLEKGLIRHCKNKSKRNQYYGFVWKYETDC